MAEGLQEAFERLTVFDVWGEAPLAGEVPSRDGLVSSPFREDRKPSFSISKEGKSFKDFSNTDHKGGVWNFLQLCHPEWEKGQIARHMMELAGVEDAKWKPAGKAVRREERVREAQRFLQRFRREQMRVPEVPAEMLEALPPQLMQKWDAWHQSTPAEFLEQLAGSRGWPVEWARELWLQDRMVRGIKGDVAFAVDLWDVTQARPWPIAIHQRFVATDGAQSWFYLPNPRQDGLQRCAAPFFAGSPQADVWLVAEGQWDAATAYGLLGGFDEFPSVDCCCWGLRGASGPDTFLGLYAEAIRKRRIRIILIPDNDDAGEPWIRDRQPQKGIPAKWSFMRRLRAITGAPVSYLLCPRREGVKDLNDLYRREPEFAREKFTQSVMRLLG